jgi:RNase P protein component
MIEAHLSEVKTGFDVVILVRPAAATATKEELRAHVMRVFKKGGLL